MSDESTWLADGATLYFSPKPSASFVGLHNATLARHIAEWHNAQLAALVAETEQWHATNRDAAQALAQAEAKASILQAQLGGWEAQCAAQLLVLQDVADFLGRPDEHPADDSGMRELAERVRTVSGTDAGRLVLVELAAMRELLLDAAAICEDIANGARSGVTRTQLLMFAQRCREKARSE